MSKSPTKIDLCPPDDTVAQLISGSLDEIDAERLFEHIGRCSKCQKVVEELERRADGVLLRAEQVQKKQKSRGSKTCDGQLSDLIRKAQNLGGRDTGLAESERSTIPIDNFVNGLKRCGLFEASEVDSLLSDVTVSDSSTIAKALVGKKKLTPFQARVLLKGRWKGLVLGNYELLDKLGQGGMGSVFRARHRRLRRIVCVKVMNLAGRKSPQMIERFRNEMRTVAALSHPNFVVAHDADEAEGVPFLVMEYVEGSDLSKHVAANGPMPVEQVLPLILQAATALQYAHDQGVTHRDIKPHNLLLSHDSETGNNTVTILDMGLARFDALLSDNPDTANHAAMTNTGVIMGTVDYMSPEQAIRSRDADNRSDIYSLGCTLHFLLTGQPVYDGDTIMARLIAHREQQIPSLSAACQKSLPQIDAVFSRMIAKRPEDRYQAMQEVADDISAIQAGRAPVALAVEEAASVSILEKRRELRKSGSSGTWMVTAGLFCIGSISLWMAFLAMNSSSSSSSSSSSNSNTNTNTNTNTASTVATESESPPMNLPANLESHDNTILAGGSGEALLVVPYHSYHANECRKWEDALRSEGMLISYASAKQESPHPKHDKQHHIAEADMVPLNPFRSRGFDTVILVGGSTNDFNSDSEALNFALLQSLSGGSVIGRLESSQYNVVGRLVNNCNCSEYKGKIRYATPPYRTGALLEVAREDDIGAIVRRVKELRIEQRESQQKGITSVLGTLDRNRELSRGGNGRVLVVLPMQSYHFHEYEDLNRHLEKRGVHAVLASSTDGWPKSNNGKTMSQFAEIRLRQFEPKYFDAVILVGGSVSEFQTYPVFDALQYVVESALNNGVCVAATSKSSLGLLASKNRDKAMTHDYHGQVQYGSPANASGSLAFAKTPGHMGELVDKVMALRNHAIRTAAE